MEKEKEYQVTLTQREVDDIRDAIFQLDNIFAEINGEGLGGFGIANVERLVDLEGLRDMLFKQTHDDDGDWL